jgi:hypothetical protein
MLNLLQNVGLLPPTVKILLKNHDPLWSMLGDVFVESTSGKNQEILISMITFLINLSTSVTNKHSRDIQFENDVNSQLIAHIRKTELFLHINTWFLSDKDGITADKVLTLLNICSDPT